MNSALCKGEIAARFTLFEREYNGRIYKADILYLALDGAAYDNPICLIPCVYSEKKTETGEQIDPETLYTDTPASAVRYIASLGRAAT